MAENKNSFVLYADLIHTVRKMDDDKAGALFKHILSYVNDENPVTDDLIVELTFEPIKQQLKRDLKKWENRKGNFSKAGITSAVNKYKNSIQKNIESVDLNAEKIKIEKQLEKKSGEEYYTQCLSFINNLIQQGSTTLNDVKQGSTKSTVSDNVSDSANVNDNVIGIKSSILLSETNISDVEEGLQDYFKIALEFQKLFIKNLKSLESPHNKQDVAKFKNYVLPIKRLFEIDGVTKNQVRAVYKYLDSKEGDFWKANILSTDKLRKKFQELSAKANTNGKTNNGSNGGGAKGVSNKKRAATYSRSKAVSNAQTLSREDSTE